MVVFRILSVGLRYEERGGGRGGGRGWGEKGKREILPEIMVA